MNKELNKEILQTITTHRDFGKMNPIDIGVQCGYKETDVEVAIQSGCSFAKMCRQEMQDKYYFVLSDEMAGYFEEGRADIVEFDLSNRSVSIVRHFNKKNCIIKLEGTIFAKAERGTKYVYWENIVTGENGVFDIGFPIYDLLVNKEGIVVVCVSRDRYKDIVKVTFSDERKTLQIESPFWNGQELVEYKNKIYEIADGKVWRIGKEFESIQELEMGYSPQLFAYGFGDNEIYCYTSKGEFSYDTLETKMCTDEMIEQFRYQTTPNKYFYIMETKTYRVLGDTILNKETQQCSKIRSLSQGSSFIIGRNEEERSQVVSLYSRNIVLFVRSGSMIGVLDLNSGVESYYEPLDL